MNFRRLKKVPYQNFWRALLKVILLITAIVLVGKIFPSLAGMALCLLMLSGYYGAIAYATRFCNVNFREMFLSDLPRILTVAVVSTIFIGLTVNAQQTIYIWDSLETWEPTIECSELTFTDPHQALKNLRGSINHADYNNFLPMLMALPMHLFGKSFLCYVLYVWLMFALPAIFFATATVKAFLERAGVKIFPVSMLMALTMLVPAQIVPLFVGYANVSILLPGAIIFAMLLSLDRSQLQRERLILIALLCVFAVFQARTAVYMIFGLFTSYAVFVMFTGGLTLLPKKFLNIGGFALLMTLPLFATFLKRTLIYDISTAYAAYQLGMSFAERLIAHAEYLGFVPYAIFLFGAIIALCNKKIFPQTAFLLTWAAMSVMLICRVQLMDRQHFYTMILPFAFLIALSINFALSRKKIIGAVLIGLLTFNFLQTFCTPINLSPIFNAGYVIPIRRDIDDIKNFVAEMNGLTVGTDKKIYLLASSALYNANTLRASGLPERHDALPSLMSSADVDMRDGFPTRFFDADFVIVSEPIQTHLLPKDQSVVVKLAEWITNSSPIARHFKPIKSFTFNATGEPVTFTVYEKISPFEQSDIDFAEKFFVELYPNADNLFKAHFEQYKAQHFAD